MTALAAPGRGAAGGDPDRAAVAWAAVALEPVLSPRFVILASSGYGPARRLVQPRLVDTIERSG
jgi:hypothetical protein